MDLKTRVRELRSVATVLQYDGLQAVKMPDGQVRLFPYVMQDGGVGVPTTTSSSSQTQVGIDNPEQLGPAKRKKKTKQVAAEYNCPQCNGKMVEQGSKTICEQCGYQTGLTVGQMAPVLQIDMLHRVVTGIVQIPDVPVTPASMPDTELIYPRDTIKQMAWGFLENERNGDIGISHQEVQDGKIVKQNGQNAVTVESYVAPIDMCLQNGKKIPEGSWVCSWKITSDKAWDDVLSGRLKASSLASNDVDFEVLGDA